MLDGDFLQQALDLTESQLQARGLDVHSAVTRVCVQIVLQLLQAWGEALTVRKHQSPSAR